MLTFNLRSIMKTRGIEHPLKFLMRGGISRSAGWRLLQRETQTVRIGQIERICTLLLCEPNDLFAWRADKGVAYPDEFPLKRLERVEVEGDIMEALSKMPLDKLKEVAKVILDKGYEEKNRE